MCSAPQQITRVLWAWTCCCHNLCHPWAQPATTSFWNPPPRLGLGPNATDINEAEHLPQPLGHVCATQTPSQLVSDGGLGFPCPKPSEPDQNHLCRM